MKFFLLNTAIFLLMGTQTFAQNTVSADEIIRKINRGEDIRYENIEIEGVLDLTNLENRIQTKDEGGWFSDNNNQYKSQVDVKLEFIKCTFLDDVLAYYHDDRGKSTYIANFEEDVIFRQCSFKRDSEFKYSEFPEEADFSLSVFEEEANFKYAEFNEGPNFKQVVFREEANFKYAEFDDQPKYDEVVFENDANFKYADFPKGVSFGDAIFNDLANFKYSKFSEPLNLDNVVFNGDEDFKYTKVEGKDFTTYLLNNR